MATGDGTRVIYMPYIEDAPAPYPVESLDVMSGISSPLLELPAREGWAVEPDAPEWIWTFYNPQDDSSPRIIRFNIDSGELEELCELHHVNNFNLTLADDIAVYDGNRFAVKILGNDYVYVASVP